jgi:curli biogenesis system outer membrane secretion channel CsgG
LTARLIGNILEISMKKSLKLLGCLALLLLAGCSSTKSSSRLDKSLIDESISSYAGLKAKIAVNDFELKTSGIDAQTGVALKEYLVSILNSTKRFIIVVPQEADLMINIGVIEFIPESSGGKSGIAGGGSSASSFMGGLLGEVSSTANMQLNLRIIDCATSNIINSRDIQSQAEEDPGRKIKTPQDKVFKSYFSEYTATPMGKVINDCLTEADRYIAQNVPLNYYKN